MILPCHAFTYLENFEGEIRKRKREKEKIWEKRKKKLWQIRVFGMDIVYSRFSLFDLFSMVYFCGMYCYTVESVWYSCWKCLVAHDLLDF